MIIIKEKEEEERREEAEEEGGGGSSVLSLFPTVTLNPPSDASDDSKMLW